MVFYDHNSGYKAIGENLSLPSNLSPRALAEPGTLRPTNTVLFIRKTIYARSTSSVPWLMDEMLLGEITKVEKLGPSIYLP